MKNTLIILFLLSFSSLLGQSQNNQKKALDITRISENWQEEFNYPYLLYIPETLKLDTLEMSNATLLVIPNNTGTTNDSLNYHEEVARKQMRIWAMIADKLKSPVWMPIFPRTKLYSKIYTHALDRDVLTSTDTLYRRLDLQLISMIDNSRKVLKNRKIVINYKVWITGYLASGMFANRFAFLHPEQLKAAAIGSPGWWPIAPILTFNMKELRYPIGISDLFSLTKKEVNMYELKKIPMLIYMGDEDDNDSVIYDDGYEPEDKDLIFELFGDSPIKRWALIEEIYQQQNLNATFQLYSGVKHTINNDMIADIVKFFLSSKWKI